MSTPDNLQRLHRRVEEPPWTNCDELLESIHRPGAPLGIRCCSANDKRRPAGRFEVWIIGWYSLELFEKSLVEIVDSLAVDDFGDWLNSLDNVQAGCQAMGRPGIHTACQGYTLQVRDVQSIDRPSADVDVLGLLQELQASRCYLMARIVIFHFDIGQLRRCVECLKNLGRATHVAIRGSSLQDQRNLRRLEICLQIGRRVGEGRGQDEVAEVC